MQLRDFFKHYKSLPHQDAAIQKLQEGIPPALLSRDAEWYKTWQVGGKQTAANPLPVPYQSQRDNYRDAGRTCFSSSCAMLVMALKPGAIHSDDQYIKTVFSVGDTTDASVQLKALAHYGIKAQFVQNGNRALIKKQIDSGIPVPCGFLHHGPVSAPSGGGHWLCVIGYDATGYIVNDPWGEIDLQAGTYPSTNGAARRYSYTGWEPRWMADGPNTGWCIVAF